VPLTLADKKAVVAKISDVARQALAVVAVDYHGLCVNEMTDLRVKARQQGVALHIVRNTLTRLAFQGTEHACMNEVLTGPLCLAFAIDSPGAAARVMRDFAKDHTNLEVRAISIGGQLLAAHQLGAVANLPTRDEAISQLMFVIKAPVAQFARTLAEPTAKLVRTIAAVRDKKAS
jgi:large subunit ribosomal protein L10